MATLQSDIGISYANQIIQIVQQLRAIRAMCAEIQVINTNTPLGNLWNALNTTALNADGTLGAADATPNNAHPIDTRVYTQLTRGQVSATQLASGLTLVLNVNGLLAGSSISSNLATPGTVDALSM